MLAVPVALLSRGRGGWRFELEAFPPHPVPEVPRFRTATLEDWGASAPDQVTDATGSPWTGLVVGRSSSREWLMLLPGSSERWAAVGALDGLIDRFGRNLESVVRTHDERRAADLHRRLYGFMRRLSRLSDQTQTHGCILETIANEVTATTASLAVYTESQQILTIVATHGYPQAIVDDVRIAPGQGVIGKTFATARAELGQPAASNRRLRYRTDSYLAIPLIADRRPVAVITLTDRADGQAFDNHDLTAARLFAAPAALALARQVVTESLDDLTRAATVDPVTGLFNRRYFETRIQAEVQRARRQQQDLALLMVDIDDFKRINDTFGHLEGDRALRDVADLLRRGVRIFDVCARYGGEEFAIVMPGATREMAVQIAERIRHGMHDRSQLAPLPMTVSIGVAFLGPDTSEEDLIGAADRALFAAKRAGKNTVKTE